MESSWNKRVEKRGYDQTFEDEAVTQPNPKKAKLPALASVIVEAVKVDSLQRLCSSLEPMFRRIVSEEVERALTRMGHSQIALRSPPKLLGPEGRRLQLHFRTRMPPHLFTGGKVEGEQGAAIHVVLLDSSTGSVVQTGPESAAKLNVVVLVGDFNEEQEKGWTVEHFESHEVKEREGKRPLLIGDLQVILNEGIGSLGDLTFTDNSSWIRSRKFRLGVKIAPGHCVGIRVREAKTEAFVVKDHRGELYKKHYPPALHDEVWRLDRIAKDGALHKKLVQAEILTVKDFLRLLVRDTQRLRSILGSGMSNRMWENTVEHAKTCVLGGKLYVYYANAADGTGVVFNHIYELRGIIADGQFLPLESVAENVKISVDSLVKQAYENWHQVVEYDGKFLNSLPHPKQGQRAMVAPIVNNTIETNLYTSCTQSRQQDIPYEPGAQHQAVNSHLSVPQLIEFPFARPDQSALMPSNEQAAVCSGGDSMTGETAPELKTAYFSGDWTRPRNGHGIEDLIAQEIRLRSSEMLETDDMQRLLRTFSMGVGVGMGPGFCHSDEALYSYGTHRYNSQMEGVYRQERGRGSGKAVVGWLKLKAALRWGIFVRKKAAERRAQLVELD